MTDERTAAMDALIADSADLIDAPASADAPEVDNQIVHASENYTRGLRDLSAMPHVTAEIGGVLRDCADWIDQAAALSAMSPAGEVERAVLAERERCAKIVEARVEPSWHSAAKNGAQLIAQAIREPKP